MVSYLWNLLICLALRIYSIHGYDAEHTINITMPSIQPQHDDDYYCTAVKLDPSKRTYIKNFIPHAEKSYAHHMLLYTCEEPGQQEKYWKCGEMASGDGSASPPCKTGTKIIYAWAMNAHPLLLAEDISFEVGGDTQAKFLVLNVHYKDVSKFKGDERDASGFTLEISKTKTPKLAGIYLLSSAGVIMRHSIASQETACQMNQDTVMHPFAFRVHTHSHGVKVSGYKIHNNTWKLIGEMDPQKEQMFYEVQNPEGVIISASDFIAARCDFENNEDRDIETGPTQNDEMCNFYIMYYVDEGNELVKDGVCFKNINFDKFFDDLDIKIPEMFSNSIKEMEEEFKPDPMSLFMKLLKAREQQEEELFDETKYFPHMKRNDEPIDYYRSNNDETNYFPHMKRNDEPIDDYRSNNDETNYY